MLDFISVLSHFCISYLDFLFWWCIWNSVSSRGYSTWFGRKYLLNICTTLFHLIDIQRIQFLLLDGNTIKNVTYVSFHFTMCTSWTPSHGRFWRELIMPWFLKWRSPHPQDKRPPPTHRQQTWGKGMQRERASGQAIPSCLQSQSMLTFLRFVCLCFLKKQLCG